MDDERTRCDWRQLFVRDPQTDRYSLIAGATPDDVERRLLNCQREIAESEAHRVARGDS
jgi:hypothetical protein